MNSILCSRCGSNVTFALSAVTGLPVIPSHPCDRFMVAERWEDGRIVETQSSFVPGLTGPVQLVRVRRFLLEDAGQFRLPTPEDPWSLRWALDAELDSVPA